MPTKQKHDMNPLTIFPSFYLPPIPYFQYIKQQSDTIYIEKYENFVKQSYRTRSRIGTSNGPLDLIIPIVHEKKERKVIKDIQISYEFDWRRLHWLSMQTAYRSTPYFEFYEDQFENLYFKKEKFLIDFNHSQLDLVFRLIKINKAIEWTDQYLDSHEVDLDLRTAIHPRKHITQFQINPYYQIFEEKVGFMPNLSIVDLLFHQGPHSIDYL